MTKEDSFWSPLALPAFRALWLAALVTNLGGVMLNIGASWLMTGLTTSPALVALVQTAFSLPAFVVSLPAGVVADVKGKRRVMFFAAAWMGCAALAMAAFTALGWMTPWLLLAFVLLLGIGQSCKIPAWQAVVQDIVPRKSIAPAVSLNAMNFNLARTVGPAVGGALVAWFGSALVFLLAALGQVAMLFAVRSLNHPKPTDRPTVAMLLGAFREGFREVATNARIRAGMIRLSAFVAASVSLWAFLPLIAREEFGLDATGFGFLLAAFGFSSILGALFVPRLRRLFSVDRILAVLGCILMTAFLVLAFSSAVWHAVVAVVLAGFSWVGCMVNFNVTVQLLSPAPLRTRIMSFYFLVLQGSWALSSAMMGWVGSLIGLRPALVLAAGLIACTVLLGFFIRLAPPKKDTAER